MGDEMEVTDDEIQKRRDARIFCFVDDEETQRFDLAHLKMLRELHKRYVSLFVNENNNFGYTHGTNWISPTPEGDAEAQMQTFSTEWSIPKQGIVDNDLSLIDSLMMDAVESLNAQFAKGIYGVAEAAAQGAGNVLSDKETGSTALSFLEMLKRIEFGVDRDGKVSLPQIHAGPGVVEKMMAELSSQPPEFSEEVERVKAERSKLALQKEAERKARFKTAS
jgi:hypothetical protein